MALQIDIDKLSYMIKSKRGEKGLRTIAKEIGVSASTLSRVEQKKLPDIDTFIELCKWLDISPEFVTKKSDIKSKSPSNKDVIVAHLRADRTLSQETQDALVEMINLAYIANKKK